MFHVNNFCLFNRDDFSNLYNFIDQTFLNKPNDNTIIVKKDIKEKRNISDITTVVRTPIKNKFQTTNAPIRFNSLFMDRQLGLVVASFNSDLLFKKLYSFNRDIANLSFINKTASLTEKVKNDDHEFYSGIGKPNSLKYSSGIVARFDNGNIYRMIYTIYNTNAELMRILFPVKHNIDEIPFDFCTISKDPEFSLGLDLKKDSDIKKMLVLIFNSFWFNDKRSTKNVPFNSKVSFYRNWANSSFFIKSD